MFKRFLAAQLLGVCLLSGCVCSVHPILTESDLTTDIDLSGTWEPKRSPVATKDKQQESEARKAYTFVATKFPGLESEYDVTWKGKDFHGQLGKIGDEYFLQLVRTELEPEIQPLLHAVPVYAIARVDLVDNNTLEVSVIDEVRAPKLLAEAGLAHIRYVPSAPIEYFVLTGSTESMQKIFEQQSEKLFTKKGLFSRAKRK
jgi:hypothetical protein